MMNRGIIVVIFYLIGFSGTSQTYYPFPKDSATWSDLYVEYDLLIPFRTYCDTYHYGLVGDTLIDSIMYSRLFHNKSISDTAFNINNAKYKMGIREDSTRKVWMRRPSDTLDVLFYDFGLNVGDTFYSSRTAPLVVSIIDSLLVQGEYRRMTHFHPIHEQASIIEGIGFKSGLMGPINATDYGMVLRCFTQNGQVIHENALFTRDCNCIRCHCNSKPIGVEIINNSNDKLKIIPNPVTHFFSISIDYKDCKSSNVEIYSFTGQNVITTQINGDNNTIDVTHLKQGLYIVRVENSESSSYGRFLKTTP